MFFFFSSRRRHTRLVSDWSSDVCSSDLARGVGLGPRAQGHRGIRRSGDRDQAAARSLRRARARVGERMSVTHDEVRRIARLAELDRSEEHTSELQSLTNLVCRLLLEKKK